MQATPAFSTITSVDIGLSPDSMIVTITRQNITVRGAKPRSTIRNCVCSVARARQCQECGTGNAIGATDKRFSINVRMTVCP
jgi:hypothetical protein